VRKFLRQQDAPKRAKKQNKEQQNGNSSPFYPGTAGGSFTSQDFFNTSLTVANNTNTGNGTNGYATITFEEVPEPSTYLLFGFGALALVVATRWKTS
jgi:hypothetical protein